MTTFDLSCGETHKLMGFVTQARLGSSIVALKLLLSSIEA